MFQEVEFIDLRQTGNVRMEIGVAFEHRQDALEIVLPLVHPRRPDVGCDHRNANGKRQRQPTRVTVFVLGARKRTFLSGVAQQGQIESDEFFVEPGNRLVCRIDMHDIGYPLDQ